MSESKLSKTVGAIIKTMGGHVSRVEAAESAAGIPDIDFCVDGIEGHIELKYGTSSKPPELRPSQYKWFKHRTKAGGKPFFLVLDGDTDLVHLIEGRRFPMLKGHTTIWKWGSLATKSWQLGDDFKRGLEEHIKKQGRLPSPSAPAFPLGA